MVGLTREQRAEREAAAQAAAPEAVADAAPKRRFQTRAETTMEERRQRYGGSLSMASTLKLELPAEMYEPGAPLDRRRFVSRWINDEGNRLHEMMNRGGYDLVAQDGEAGLMQVSDARQDGTLLRYPVGTQPTGEPIYAYLARKPKEWADEEDREVVERTRRQTEGILRGERTDIGSGDRSATIDVENSYIPSTNSISREVGRTQRRAGGGEYRP